MTRGILISSERVDITTVPGTMTESTSSEPRQDVAWLTTSALRWFFVTLALLAVCQGILNYVVNPLGAFGSHGYLRYDIRASEAFTKKRWLDSFLDRNAGTPITVALGSSRVMALGEDAAVDGSPYFNAGIPGGKGEDILAFSRYLIEYPNVEVGQVIISVDPAVFRSVDADAYGLRVEGIDGLESELDDRISRSARVRSTIASVLGTDWAISLQEQVVGREVTTRHFDRESGVRQDSYFETSRLKAAGSRERMLATHIDSVVNDAESIEWSEQRENDLREAVRILTDRGATVTLVLMPYNPALLSELQQIDNYRDHLTSTQALMTDLAQQYEGVVACDLSDPVGTALTDDALWWDGYHYTTQGAGIVAEQVRTCADQSAYARVQTAVTSASFFSDPGSALPTSGLDEAND